MSFGKCMMLSSGVKLLSFIVVSWPLSPKPRNHNKLSCIVRYYIIRNTNFLVWKTILLTTGKIKKKLEEEKGKVG